MTPDFEALLRGVPLEHTDECYGAIEAGEGACSCTGAPDFPAMAQAVREAVKGQDKALRYSARERVRLGEERNGLLGEVERLKKLVFSPLGDNHHNAAVCPYCGDPLRKAQAEIDRLRGALEKIAEEWGTMQDNTIFIAQAALAPAPTP